jgi:hypothetical protein
VRRWRSSSDRTALAANSNRLAGILLVAVLAIASVTALIVNQRLRAGGLVIEALHIEEDFAPSSGTDDLAEIDFRVNKGPEKIDVEILDSHGGVVDHLAEGKEAKDNEVVKLAWDGQNDDGEAAPTGAYTLRIKLLDRGRTISPRQEISLEDEAD